MLTTDAYVVLEYQIVSWMMQMPKFRRFMLNINAKPLRCSLVPIHNSIEHEAIPVN
jgi:hypothetical protein